MSYISAVTLPGANQSAFGDFIVANSTPLLQLSFAAGLRDQLVSTSTVSTGIADTNASRLRLQTGTGSTGSAIVQSVKPVGYRPGQGVTARFTPSWLTSATNSVQYFGMGNVLDGYFYGYTGTDFGILHRNNGVDSWILQDIWNGDKCNGTGASGFNWNPQYGVPMMVRYPYLGYGNIFFYVQNPETGAWILCHTIKYADTTSTVQISNPILSVYGQVLNDGNTTNLTMHVGSVGVFIDGEREYLGPQFGIEATRATVTTEAPIVSLRNATTINGVPNRASIRVRALSIASDGGNGIGLVRLRRNSTLTNPTFSPVSGSTANNGITLTNAQSIISTDTAATFSGGTIIFNLAVGRNSASVIDVTSMNLFIGPGEVITITGQSGASATLSVAINWQEDIQ